MRPALNLTAFTGTRAPGMGAIVMQPVSSRRRLGAPPGMQGLGLFSAEERAAAQAEMQAAWQESPVTFWVGGLQGAAAGAFWGGMTGLVSASSWKGAGQGAMFMGGLAGVMVGGAYLFGGVTLPGAVYLGAGGALVALAATQALKGKGRKGKRRR